MSHGATRCHQEPAVRCALGPGAAAETWSTPGTWRTSGTWSTLGTWSILHPWSTPGSWSTPGTWSTLEHLQIWSTPEHLRMWNTHGSQSTPGPAVAGGTQSTPGTRSTQVLEQPVGPGPAAQGRAVPHMPLPSERDFGLLEGCSYPPSLQRPPWSPQLHTSLSLAPGTHLGQCQPPSPPKEIPVPGGIPAPQECPVPAPQQSPRCSSPKPSSLQKCSRGAAATCEQALSQPNSCGWNRPGQLEGPYKDHRVLLMQTLGQSNSQSPLSQYLS